MEKQMHEIPLALGVPRLTQFTWPDRSREANELRRIADELCPVAREPHRYSEVGSFGAIGNAANDLATEANRVAKLGSLRETINCGEIDKLLHNIRRSTELLKKIRGYSERAD